ncbi:MAG: hypothetical protein EXR86_12360 [Gammaproteobacteria bacterium]|nr:hypothetical protein [Gammaproteobacteria bacterium]
MFVSEFVRLQPELICKHCGATGRLELYKKAPHIGTKCVECEAWNEWLKQVEAPPIETQWKPYVAMEKPPRYMPNQIAHPQTLDERVASLEHDVGVIAQIVTGKRDGK